MKRGQKLANRHAIRLADYQATVAGNKDTTGFTMPGAKVGLSNYPGPAKTSPVHGKRSTPQAANKEGSKVTARLRGLMKECNILVLR